VSPADRALIPEDPATRDNFLDVSLNLLCARGLLLHRHVNVADVTADKAIE